jgi:hypothetical protein
MRWPWKQRAKPIEPRLMANRAMQLETAKEILAEVFHTRPGEVDEMIQKRLEESGPAENIRQEKRKEGRWPATFCLGG